jgi:hypothetical protein
MKKSIEEQILFTQGTQNLVRRKNNIQERNLANTWNKRITAEEPNFHLHGGHKYSVREKNHVAKK